MKSLLTPCDPSSNLTFSLTPGWAFVETEGWRPDVQGSWVSIASDSCSASVNDTVFGADDSKFYALLSYDALIFITIDNQTAGCTRMMYGQIRVVYLSRLGRCQA
jgi:hypothetical protein